MIMDERKQHILRAVVHYYVRTAEPVSSDYICVESALGVKSATIRNEMAAMSDLGFLKQPHTSAGRIPSDLGYRFYVDRLMPWSSPVQDDNQIVEALISKEPSAVDHLVEGTCRFLSALTQLTAIATAPTSETVRLSWLDLQSVGQSRVVAFTLWSNGQLRQIVMNIPDVPSGVLPKVGRILANSLLNKTSDEIAQVEFLDGDLPSNLVGQLVRLVRDNLIQVGQDVRRPNVFVEGTSYFVRQPEFGEPSSLALVLSVLDEDSAIAQVLDAMAISDQPQVVIGEENPLDALRACSLVAAAYGTGAGIRGSIGVCGPTRMNYSNAVGAVRFAARSLSTALESLLPS